MMVARRIVIDCETVGPRDAGVREALRLDLDGEVPGQIRGGSPEAKALERAGYLDHYKGLTKGKQEWLASVWDREEIQLALLEEVCAKAAVDTLLAEVICVAVAVDEGEVELFCEWPLLRQGFGGQADGTNGTDRTDRTNGNTAEGGCATQEKAMLVALRDWLEDRVGAETVWVGHNLVGFDVPLLISRWRRHGILPPEGFPVWRHGRVHGLVFDTMKEAATNRMFVSAQRCALAHGLGQFKSTLWEGAPMDGARVGEAYAAGAFEVIGEYCRADVEATRELARLMTFGWRYVDGGRFGDVERVEI